MTNPPVVGAFAGSLVVAVPAGIANPASEGGVADPLEGTVLDGAGVDPMDAGTGPVGGVLVGAAVGGDVPGIGWPTAA